MKKTLSFIILLLLLLISQFFIFDKLFLINLPNIYVFIFFIIILPYNFNKYYILLISFLLGFFMDITNFTPGIHTIASTFIGYFRQFLLKLYSPSIKYENGEVLSYKKYGIAWLLKYYISMIFIFELIVFLFQYFSINRFFDSFLRLLLGTTLSFAFIFIFYLFFERRYGANK